jgi:hypothetical protein
MLLTRQWAHAKMLKRSARFVKPGGVSETAAGKMAVKCCSCPIDGINLPPGWEQCPPLLRCGHQRTLTITP